MIGPLSGNNLYTQWYAQPITNGLYDYAVSYTTAGTQTATAVTQVMENTIYFYQQRIMQQLSQPSPMFQGASTYGWPQPEMSYHYVETEEDRARHEKIRCSFREANNRAEELLVSILPEEHSKCYKANGHFDVEVKGRIFRIHRGRSMNITEMDRKGIKVCRWCVHTEDYLPDADTMLAQYLMLKNDERKFLEIANKHLLAA